MLHTLSARISMWINIALRPFLRSQPLRGSWVCASCGLFIVAHVEDGTSSLRCAIISHPVKLSPYKHVLEVTADGKLSISCAPLPSVEDVSQDSGQSVGTSSIPVNSVRESGRTCGCDPGAHWICERHRMENDLPPNE